MESSKLKRPSIQKQGSKIQDHATMNAWVLSNLLARFCCNEQKAIVRAKRHTFLKWDRRQVDLQYTPKLPKPTFMKLASSHILQLIGMTTWGVGALPFNMQAKLEHDENLALVIQATQAKYAKALKSV